MSEKLPKACVILGAGASFDAQNQGSPEISEEYRSPLAKDLFNINRNPQYQSTLSKYPGADFLASLLGPVSAQDDGGIESELRKYANHTDSHISTQYKHVPPYLRDLRVRRVLFRSYSPT